jgi:hypothetical protein
VRASPRCSVALLLLATTPARGDTGPPTRAGESGYLDVPSADSLGKGGAACALDLRYLDSRDVGRSFGPSPLVMQFGLGPAEAGLSLRQGGQPGDPRPATTIPAGAGKLSILDARGMRPALAADLLLDHINRTPLFHLRAIATTERRWRTRVTAIGGGVIGIDQPSGWTGGAALSVLGPRKTEFVAEILRQPAGRLAGAGVRWQPLALFAVGVGAWYLPDDARTLSAAITVAFLSPPPVRPTLAPETEKPPEEVRPNPSKRAFTSERPRFPLALRQRPVPGEPGGPARHYPGNAAALAGAPAEIRKGDSRIAPTEAPSPGPPTSEPPPARPAAPDASPEAPAPRADAGAVQETNPDAAPATAPDAAPGTTPDATPGTLPDAAPARVERPVPPPPSLKGGAGGEDQLGRAIASFQPALKQCVDRALKRDPGLRGEARIELDVLPDGRVKLASIHSDTLQGWFEACVREAADSWRLPRTPRGYRVEVPLKIHITKGDPP